MKAFPQNNYTMFLNYTLFYVLQFTDFLSPFPFFIQQFSEFLSTVDAKFNSILITDYSNLHMIVLSHKQNNF